jgi:TrmH family RNA methyltransferase
MGALFTIPVTETDSFERLWVWAATHGLQTIATSAHAQQRYWDAAYRFPALLLLGSEGEGLSAGVLQRADLAVTIPMHGSGSSLNVAVAAGLLLYELRRQAPLARG